MNIGAERYLEQAEDALTDAAGERRRSETSFLQRLLSDLGGDVAATGLSPAELFRSILSKAPMHNARDVLEVLARPSQRPEGALRPGDWILRAVPGTGDVGHVSVLASADLLTPSELESEGIAAESQQPGQYGLVIEAGAFPHSRSRRFARRVLDSRGRVPPHTVILRPQYPQAGATPNLPYDEPQGTQSVVDIQAPEPMQQFDAEPAPEEEGATQSLSLLVVDESGKPLVKGEYAVHQDGRSERGDFATAGNGLALFKTIDAAQPFLFEVRDRVCAIGEGAFIDPDDPAIEYGGTWFDWTLVRDNKDADKSFWPYYKREMDFAAQIESYEVTQGRRIDRFLQHEHITRRPIRVAKPSLGQRSKVRICATPPRIRVGPFVRYTDHERAVIWLETVTPLMVRVRCKSAAGGAESSHYGSTVRVGGRHFAAVEIDGLQQETFYDYTVELAPLPATGKIPVAPEDFARVFPKVTTPVADSIKKQLATTASLGDTEWLTFRTLRPKYDKELRFATGSCRWYPGDKKHGKDWGPDMLKGLGDWLIINGKRKEKWPHFLFFGGDQIYADEIGDDHGEMLVRERFAARIPGPVDPAGPARDKLIDGAWAGRFAHRYKEYKDPDAKLFERVKEDLKKLDELRKKYPEIENIYHRYPKTGMPDKESRVLAYQLMRGLTWGLGGAVSDQKTYDKALNLIQTVDKLNLKSGSFRIFLPHWTAGFSTAVRRNPMAHRYLSHNFLLWEIPNFEPLLPTLVNSSNQAIVPANVRGHRAAAGGRHAADFAEYAYLYERAWTSSKSVRVLLAQIPTFLMLDDHEATDDWNFDVSWVRMLHNEKDDLRMWPKTLTDGLAAYWVYQGWCNKAPSQWKSDDPRIKALSDARRTGSDALPELRKCIHTACFMQVPAKDPKDPKAPKPTFQTGLTLDWHYMLPFDPPFLVPDCRTRKFLDAADDDLKIIDHDNPKKRPMSQTIDEAQLDWMRKILVRPNGPAVAFIAPSTPLLMQNKVMQIMTKPETTAEAWEKENLPSIVSAAAGSTLLGASDALLRVFRRAKDLEHIVRDKSWRDLWGLVDTMRQAGSRVKTLVLVSGDVHHNYCMTANLPGTGRPKPELLQITCSGLQTEIRSSTEKWLAEKLGVTSFDIGKYRLVPGFMFKNNTRVPELALYENAAAFVEVTLGAKVNVRVTYLSGDNKHVYLYTSGAAYMTDGEPSDSPWQRGRTRLVHKGAEDVESRATSPLEVGAMPEFRPDEPEAKSMESAFDNEVLDTFAGYPLADAGDTGAITFELTPRSRQPQEYDTEFREDPAEQVPKARFRTVFYDQDSLRYVDGWTRAAGPSAVFLIDRSGYNRIHADGVKRGREFDRFVAQALAAAGRGRMDLQPPMYVIDPALATVPLNRASRGDWDDLMIAQLIGAGRRLTIQSQTDQWALINRLFANAKEDARRAAQAKRPAREFVAYFVLDRVKATLAMVEAINVTMQNGHAVIPLAHIRGTDQMVMPGGDAGARVIGDIHTHYLLDPLIDLNRTRVGTTIRSTQTSLHSGVSDAVDVVSARDSHIVVYAVDSKYLHRANPDGTKNDQLSRSGDVLREALRVFGVEPGLSSSG